MNEGTLILVVDDNDRDGWLLRMALRRAGVAKLVESFLLRVERGKAEGRGAGKSVRA